MKGMRPCWSICMKWPEQYMFFFSNRMHYRGIIKLCLCRIWWNAIYIYIYQCAWTRLRYPALYIPWNTRHFLFFPFSHNCFCVAKILSWSREAKIQGSRKRCLFPNSTIFVTNRLLIFVWIKTKNRRTHWNFHQHEQSRRQR